MESNPEEHLILLAAFYWDLHETLPGIAFCAWIGSKRSNMPCMHSNWLLIPTLRDNLFPSFSIWEPTRTTTQVTFLIFSLIYFPSLSLIYLSLFLCPARRSNFQRNNRPSCALPHFSSLNWQQSEAYVHEYVLNVQDKSATWNLHFLLLLHCITKKRDKKST